MVGKLKYLKYPIIVLVSIYFYHSFRPIDSKISNNTEFVHDTIYVDCVQVVIDTLEVVIPEIIDTAEIIQDYHTKKTVKSNYKDDKVFIRIQDELYKNTIVNRKLDYTILPRADPMRWFVNTQMYIGENGGGIAVGISLLKNRNQYSISYDPISRRTFFGFNYQVKIRSPSKKRGLINRLLRK